MLHSLIRCRDGQGLVEYALILALMSILIVASLLFLKNSMSEFFQLQIINAI
ncbi:MAG: Flp family type IVb pilin [Chloroflexi bacterium]|nr:Flp family type IVb pilin [Chloroflexota bacterium]